MDIDLGVGVGHARTISRLTELGNFSVVRSYRYVAPVGARKFTRLRGGAAGSSVRSGIVVESQSREPIKLRRSDMYFPHDLNGNCPAKPMSLLTELENYRNGLF